MKDLNCTCTQRGNYCRVHPNCACGCPKHAHSPVGCIAGSMNCHGCAEYRPAQVRRFSDLDDDALAGLDVVALREAYQQLRAHHIEETTALWTRVWNS